MSEWGRGVMVAEQPPGALREINELEALFAAPSYDVPVEARAADQEYARSLRVVQALGQLVCENALDTPEGHGALSEAFRDYTTALQENLVTDPDFGERLKFTPVRTFAIRNNEVVDDQGRPMTTIIATGLETARKAARTDRRMAAQVERDEGDLEVARIVNTLQPQELYMVLSMDPKDAMARDGAAYWREKGYREGMAIIQLYYRKDAQTMLGGAYSLKKSDAVLLSKLCAQHGWSVPEDTPANRWTRHGLRRKASLEEALQLGPRLQSAYARMTGQPEQVSVTQLFLQNQALVRTYFDVYIKELARATHSGVNNQTIRQLAQALLANPHFDDEGQATLRKAAYAPLFTPVEARLMETAVRFAVLEALRRRIPHATPQKEVVSLGATAYDPSFTAQMNAHQIQRLTLRMAADVQQGMAAGHEWGGCTGTGFKRRLTPKDDKEPDNPLEPQDIFGGYANKPQGPEEEGPVACDYQHTGCYCCPYDEKGNPLDAPLLVTARRDESGVATCQRKACGAKLGKDGTVLSYGLIYRRAMRNKAQPTASPKPTPKSTPKPKPLPVRVASAEQQHTAKMTLDPQGYAAAGKLALAKV